MGAHKRTLEGNADAVEFCSTPVYHRVLAAASYTLVEGPTPTRVGGVYLFTLAGDTDYNLHELQTIETSGVFDIKWRKPSAGLEPCLGQASADGSMRLYTLLQNDDKPSLEQTSSLSMDSSMCLSLDWSPTEPQLAVSHSNGTLTVLSLAESDLQVSDSGEAHELETWITSYDAWQRSLVYTGADDCHFCAWDIRQGLGNPVFRNQKVHTMGVCSIQSNSQVEHCVITGSYDESVRVWDMRMGSRPVVKVAMGLGGGVWRLKWHPLDPGLVLAACMHHGFVVVRVGGDHGVEVVEEYKEHGDLAYGVDWYQGAWKGGRKSLAATCSFYDKALHVWEPAVIVSNTKALT